MSMFVNEKLPLAYIFRPPNVTFKFTFRIGMSAQLPVNGAYVARHL
jgi:hypothetical protein